jgi:hypothetical protein
MSAFVDLATPLAYQPRVFTATAQVRDYWVRRDRPARRVISSRYVAL